MGFPMMTSARVAGGLVIAVGTTNAVLGIISLTSDAINLSPGAGGGLLVLGLVTVALGVLVWRRSRAATVTALTIFGLLLVVQVGAIASAGQVAADSVPPIVVLAALVLALGWAKFRAPTSGTGG